jgi:hypothetical protein
MYRAREVCSYLRDENHAGLAGLRKMERVGVSRCWRCLALLQGNNNPGDLTTEDSTP